jgi:predicted TIM-barrel fold metal-dependent hydrolase
LEILDAQIHDARPWHEWSHWKTPLDTETRERILCELSIAGMDAVGVDAAVLSPRGPEGKGWGRRAATEYPDRFVIQKTVDPAAENIEELVRRAIDEPGVLALRATLNDLQHGGTAELDGGRFDRLFRALEPTEIPLFCFMWGDVRALGPVAVRYPGIRFIVDHLGLVQGPIRDLPSEPFEQLPDLLELARYPNVAVKLCGANVMSAVPYPHLDLWPHLHRVLDAFGVERVMWGSDYTRMRMYRGDAGWAAWYSECVGYLRETTELSEDEKAQILGRTVRTWLRWPSSGDLSRPAYRVKFTEEPKAGAS